MTLNSAESLLILANVCKSDRIPTICFKSWRILLIDSFFTNFFLSEISMFLTILNFVLHNFKFSSKKFQFFWQNFQFSFQNFQNFFDRYSSFFTNFSFCFQNIQFFDNIYKFFWQSSYEKLKAKFPKNFSKFRSHFTILFFTIEISLSRNFQLFDDNKILKNKKTGAKFQKTLTRILFFCCAFQS